MKSVYLGFEKNLKKLKPFCWLACQYSKQINEGGLKWDF